MGRFSYTIEHTRGLHEFSMELEGDQRLFHLPKEVLQEATDVVNLVHLAEVQRSHILPMDVLLPQLLHQAIAAGNAVQSSLFPREEAQVRRFTPRLIK